MTRSYMVVYERMAEDNWGAWAQDIGGAVGAGDSLEAARQSLRDGIALMLEDLAERGLPAPAATSKSIDFSELDPNPADSHYEIEWMTVDLPEAVSRSGNQQATAA
jgi:predicted RNase H-like HicB family nuclease